MMKSGIATYEHIYLCMNIFISMMIIFDRMNIFISVYYHDVFLWLARRPNALKYSISRSV
jgi:hypothetical protein